MAGREKKVHAKKKRICYRCCVTTTAGGLILINGKLSTISFRDTWTDLLPLLLRLPFQVCLQFPGADQLVAEYTDPVHDRFNDIDRIILHLYMLKPELIDMPEAPHQLACPADDSRPGIFGGR